MDYTNNDYELIYLIKEEDETALNYMLDKYEPLIKKIASHYFCLFNNFYDLEDIIQEGRIGLYIAIKSYKSNYDNMFYTYALYCIKRQIYNLYRFYNCKKRNFSVVSLEDKEIIDYKEPLEIIQNDEYINLIINFKNSLDFKDANIFELKYNNFSYKEISSLLDFEKKEVDNRLQKIKKKLKKYMLN